MKNSGPARLPSIAGGKTERRSKGQFFSANENKPESFIHLTSWTMARSFSTWSGLMTRGGLSEVVGAGNFRSVLNLLKAGDLEGRWKKG